MRERWILSCEHGGNQIPAEYAALFRGADALLASHRGWDPGALALYAQLTPLADFSLSSTTSRLLVELNRSLHHSALFSAQSKILAEEKKQEVLREYYHPYRKQLEKAVGEFIASGESVLHISIHSFTPVLNGEVRTADLGLLYDPARNREKGFCRAWKKSLLKHLPEFRTRFNYPYKGTADGFTTHLRKKFPHHYAGIELELNQKWMNQDKVYNGIYQSLRELKPSQA